MVIGEGTGLAGGAATAGCENDDSGTFTQDDTEFNIFNTDRQLAAMEDAVKKLAAFPEKKALIYFSSGISKNGIDNQSQLKNTINSAVRANVAIYSVDARGLQASAPSGDAIHGLFARHGQHIGFQPAEPAQQLQRFAGDAHHSVGGYRRQGAAG